MRGVGVTLSSQAGLGTPRTEDEHTMCKARLSELEEDWDDEGPLPLSYMRTLGHASVTGWPRATQQGGSLCATDSATSWWDTREVSASNPS